jgi:hypothetical protein
VGVLVDGRCSSFVGVASSSTVVLALALALVARRGSPLRAVRLELARNPPYSSLHPLNLYGSWFFPGLSTFDDERMADIFYSVFSFYCSFGSSFHRSYPYCNEMLVHRTSGSDRILSSHQPINDLHRSTTTTTTSLIHTLDPSSHTLIPTK